MNIDIDIKSISKDKFKKYTVVDIRETPELVADPSLIECPHVPLSALPDKLSFFNKEQEYLIFCHRGGRSHQLADYLNANGYKALSINHGVSALNAYIESNDLA